MNQATATGPDLGPLLAPLRREGKDALADRVQAAIHSSPYLEEMVSSAMRSGTLKGITEAGIRDPSAYYTRHDGTISVNFHGHDIHRLPTLSMMVDYRLREELLGPEEDRLVPTLAHEAFHALTPRALDENRDQLRRDFAEQVRKAGQDGTIDITTMVRGFQDREFMNEATAEVHGWNALMSRIEHQHGGPMVAQLSRSLDDLLGDFGNHVAMAGGTTAKDQAMFRERGEDYAECVGPAAGTTPPLSAGVHLDARGMIDPSQSRRWAECALDQRFYDNENFLHALATIRTMRDATRFKGTLQADTGALGVDVDAQLERARNHPGWVQQPLQVHDREHGPLLFGSDGPRQPRHEAPAQDRAAGGPAGLEQPPGAGDAAERAALHGQLAGTLRDMLPPDTTVARPWIDRFTGAAWDAGMRAGDPIDVLVSPQGVTLRGRHPTHVALVDLHGAGAGDAAREAGPVRIPEAPQPERSPQGLLQ